MRHNQEDNQSILTTVSLLSASTGLLQVSAISSDISPDWLIPTSLILDTVDVTEKISNLQWQGSDIPLYSLAKDMNEYKVVVIESTTDVYRVGLLVGNSPIEHKMRISELSDTDDEVDSPFCLQAVKLEGELHMVPDLDKLSRKLIDLD